jgi:hypothetical protein
MMRHLKFFFEAFQGSCLSFSSYTRLMKESMKKSLFYLAGLSVLLGSVFLYAAVIFEVKPFLKKITEEFPDMAIDKGLMTTALKEPVIILNNQFAVIVIPPGAQKKTEDIVRETKKEMVMSLEEKNITLYSVSGPISTKKWSDIFVQDPRSPQRYTITKKDLKFLYRVSDLLFIPVFFFSIVLFFVWDITKAVYFAAFAFLFVRIMEVRVPEKEKMDLSSIFKVCIYASTPGALLMTSIGAILLIFHSSMDLSNIRVVYSVMYASFIIGAVYHYKRSLTRAPYKDDDEEDGYL